MKKAGKKYSRGKGKGVGGGVVAIVAGLACWEEGKKERNICRRNT